MGDDRDRERFTLRWLFHEHTSLSTVLGVFAAMTVYLTQLESPSRVERLGLVSSLHLFLFLGGGLALLHVILCKLRENKELKKFMQWYAKNWLGK